MKITATHEEKAVLVQIIDVYVKEAGIAGAQNGMAILSSIEVIEPAKPEPEKKDE